MAYAGKRRTDTAAGAGAADPGDDPARDGGWIADYYRRQQLASVFSVNADTESEYPFLRVSESPFPAAEALDESEVEAMPRLAAGVELLGEYQGSGLTEVTYLVRRPGGQVVQVSRLLYLALDETDGRRTVAEIAARVTVAFGRTVSAGNVEYLLENKLAPLGLVEAPKGTGRAQAGGPAPAILGLRLRRTLVPAPAVQHIARMFRPLFTPVVVVAVLALLIGSDTWLFRGGRTGAALDYVVLHPVLLLAVLGLSVLSLLFHECGHATACRYGGARPGVIGCGFFVIWPAFFTNVTDAYRLGRAGRIRTDLGGVYFNAVFALMLAAAYLATDYAPLLAAVVVVHLEIIQQLMPSLRFDGYFILADLIGVPDLFRRIGPVLRSLIPGQPTDPRVRDLKRAARIALTAWVLAVVTLLGLELALIILNVPGLGVTFARSLDAQAHAVAGQFRRADIADGLVSVISLVLLVLPTAGLCYILLLTARRALRAVIAVNRRHPALRVPSAVTVLLVAAALLAHWGFVPIGHHTGPPHAPAADAAAQRPAPTAASASASASAEGHRARAVPETRPVGVTATVLTPVSVHGFDALNSPGIDPYDENDDLAGYAIDNDPATAWHSQYYLGNPVFGGLKKGSGLILDMGSQVRLSSVTVTFGPAPGADVAIEIGNDNTLAAATLPTFTTVAQGTDIGGTYTFNTANPAKGRYVLIWFTKLPPDGPGRFAAEIFDIQIRGSR
jgi:putative peptide zinc metalloprotease protein